MRSVIIFTRKSSTTKTGASQADITSRIQLRYAVIQYYKTSYREISHAEIPEQIEITLSEFFSGFKLKKVFKGNDGTYKITGILHCRTGTVVFNRNGEILKVEASGHRPENNEKR